MKHGETWVVQPLRTTPFDLARPLKSLRQERRSLGERLPGSGLSRFEEAEAPRDSLSLLRILQR